MTNVVADLWRRLRDRVAHRIAQLRAKWRAGNARPAPQAETIRVLEEWLDCSRHDVQREQADLVHEREEVVRQRAEVTRERAENDRLRAEIDQLRLDNRALLNSLLGTAGIPPLEVPRIGADAPPVRRPSWPQIAAKREITVSRRLEAERRRHDAKQDAKH